MNAEEKERFRWQFAGYIYAFNIGGTIHDSVDLAGELIDRLERTAPKEPEKPVDCEHEYGYPFINSTMVGCIKCGATR